jgi:hypothetical protein
MKSADGRMTNQSGSWAVRRQVDVKRPYRRCAGSHDPEVVMIEAIVPIKAD